MGILTDKFSGLKNNFTERKVSGSSLFETIVAISILTVVSGIAMAVYLKISHSALTGQKVKAAFLVNELKIKTRTSANYMDAETEIDGIKLIKEIKEYSATEGLYLIHIKAFNSEEKLLAESREIVLTD